MLLFNTSYRDTKVYDTQNITSQTNPTKEVNRTYRTNMDYKLEALAEQETIGRFCEPQRLQ